MHPVIGNVCSKPEGGVDHDLLDKLKHGPYSLDDLLDIDEIDRVGRSHRDAAEANAQAEADAQKAKAHP